MALARFARHAKRPQGVWVKATAVAVMGLCFIVVWSVFSSPSTSVTTQRESFDDIREPVSSDAKLVDSSTTRPSKEEPEKLEKVEDGKKMRSESDKQRIEEKSMDRSVSSAPDAHQSRPTKRGKQAAKPKEERNETKLPGGGGNDEDRSEDSEAKDVEDGVDEEVVIDNGDETANGESETNRGTKGNEEMIESVDSEGAENAEGESEVSKVMGKKRKPKGPVFYPKAHYSWKVCRTKSKHNYIPCIDHESGRFQSYRHSERSCPGSPPMCLVPLPLGGYESPVKWPESKEKINHKNVAHPKLDAYIKKHSWVIESGEHLEFPRNHSEFVGGASHYLEFIEEMVPDIEWGKNIRVVLDIGCKDSGFAASLLDKDIIILTLGLKDDLVDLAQVALERGFPAIVSHFATTRLPFPSMVFDTIHCGGCNIPWHHHGGKLLLEINRILRPGGYFVLSGRHESIEEEEAMSTLTASICWNILAHKTDEVSEVGVKVYHKPESNDIYELRRRRNPPLCPENDNPNAAWYVPMKTCLHSVPASVEERGTEWPMEWPNRLETLPDWLENKDKISADTSHWRSIFENSYLSGIGIDWSNIRNVMDMKSIYGGFAAALSKQNVWVMNVVPVHAPNTLPIIFERGLLGIYHNWCESFGSYPRSYDLLHADHLFSRLKNRCKQPVAIVVEMDRILRPGGWVIVRDKVEILDPLEGILRSLRWEIRLTYAQDKEGILCAQKTSWRP